MSYASLELWKKGAESGKQVYIKRRQRKNRKETLEGQKAARKARAADTTYQDKRREEFLYYINRSELTLAQMSRALNISYDWLIHVSDGTIKKPGEYRVATIIDFVKDFERLQTYYAALLK